MVRKYVLGSLALLFSLVALITLTLPYYQGFFNVGTIYVTGYAFIFGLLANGAGDFAGLALTCIPQASLIITAIVMIFSVVVTVASLIYKNKLTFIYCLLNSINVLLAILAGILTFSFLAMSGITLKTVPEFISESLGIGAILGGISLFISAIFSVLLTIFTYFEYRFQIEQIRRKEILENPELAGRISSISYLPFFNVKAEDIKEPENDEHITNLDEQPQNATIQSIGQLSEEDLEYLLKRKRKEKGETTEEDLVIKKSEALTGTIEVPTKEEITKDTKEEVNKTIETERVEPEEDKNSLDYKIKELKNLLDNKVISEEEFQSLKDKVIKDFLENK